MSAALQLDTLTPLAWSILGMINSSRCPRDAASMYARLGLHPIRLHGVIAGKCTCDREECTTRAGKHPTHASWQRRMLVREQLDRALTQHWRSNLGLRMGHQPDGSRLICIDVDGPLTLLDPFIERAGKLPPTLTASSGRGYHLYFRLPEGVPMPRNRTALAPGLDIRSEGGQVVAPPSAHYLPGRRYDWLMAMEPAVLP